MRAATAESFPRFFRWIYLCHVLVLLNQTNQRVLSQLLHIAAKGHRDGRQSIITFDTSDYDSELPVADTSEARLSADIVISLDTVKANSLTYGTSFSQELYRVMVHGILHLVGYDDLTEQQSGQMRAAENNALALLPHYGIEEDQKY